jgi:hypothetical protein
MRTNNQRSTKIESGLAVACLTALTWFWQYGKFSNGYGLFFYFGRYGFWLMVFCHVAMFCWGLKLVWGKGEPTEGDQNRP